MRVIDALLPIGIRFQCISRRAPTMLKPMTIIYPVMPAKDEAERAALRRIGRNRELYHAAIHGASDIVRAADEMGLWDIGTIEHHFWSEAYEVAPAPSVVQAYWRRSPSASTSGARLRHGDAQPGARGGGDRGAGSPGEGPHVRRPGVPLPVALDQRDGPAFRHARH
jgi:hypothetical protein